MEGLAIIGNTATMELSFLESIIKKAGEVGALRGIEEYKLSKMKDTVLSVNQVAKRLGATSPTVTKYITIGHKKAGKLKAEPKGNTYIVNEYDLMEFKAKLKF